MQIQKINKQIAYTTYKQKEKSKSYKIKNLRKNESIQKEQQLY